MGRHYVATFYPAREGGYTVAFKDFPEALTQGNDWDEAMAMARDALALTIEEYTAAGRDIPAPSTDVPSWLLWSRKHDPNSPDESPFLSALVMAPDASPTRVSVSFTKSALARIDRKAADLGMTRSGYLAAAGIGYSPGPGKDFVDQLDDLGRKYGLGRKPAENYGAFVTRIFEAMEQGKAHA